MIIEKIMLPAALLLSSSLASHSSADSNSIDQDIGLSEAKSRCISGCHSLVRSVILLSIYNLATVLNNS